MGQEINEIGKLYSSEYTQRVFNATWAHKVVFSYVKEQRATNNSSWDQIVLDYQAGKKDQRKFPFVW
jgi:hypothetical protein